MSGGGPRDGTSETAALFVRIPSAQARALDRIAFESRRPKQAVVSDLLSRYISDPVEDRRRVSIETFEEPAMTVGRHAFRSYEADVLTLEQVAELLAVELEAIEQLAQTGELPGRKIGDAWRFARSAVLAWLAGNVATEQSSGEQITGDR
jgi:excisionase family DNA binding protein